ncbi:MAG: GDYXXLXY domain-containing protein [Burkholderiales bacterium]|nr:GDYXXLXY domain-containing protein [Burkholderiales bacterium]
MRTKLLWVMALVILGVVNYAVWEKEQVVNQGRTVLLELAPRDPRSLMQGDFMALNYRLTDALRSRLSHRSVDGLAVVTLDGQGVAQLDRLYQAGGALQANQALIRFRKRGEVVRIGAESFFFQEGQAAIYSPAKYGEIKVAIDGEVVLVGLRDVQRLPLRPAKQ